jgi:hypothetical protein
LVQTFLRDHLPGQFQVDKGLLIAPNGYFSNEADLLVVDHLRNSPLHASRPERLWPVEAAYALLEIKTQLSPRDIADGVHKCRRFKTLQRNYLVGPDQPRIKSSLFVLWAYDSPATETAKSNLAEAIAEIPRAEQPDFVVVPDGFVARSGEYLELSRLGQPGSAHRERLHQVHGPDLGSLLPEPLEVYALEDNSLAAWYIWFDSWLRHAGPRLCDPLCYLEPQKIWGRKV